MVEAISNIYHTYTNREQGLQWKLRRLVVYAWYPIKFIMSWHYICRGMPWHTVANAMAPAMAFHGVWHVMSWHMPWHGAVMQLSTLSRMNVTFRNQLSFKADSFEAKAPKRIANSNVKKTQKNWRRLGIHKKYNILNLQNSPGHRPRAC